MPGRKPKSEQQRQEERELLNLGSTQKKTRVKNNDTMAKTKTDTVEQITSQTTIEPPTPPVPPTPPSPPENPEPLIQPESSNPIHQPNNNHDPLSGPVDTRSYQTQQVNQNITGEIPEAEFVIEQPKIDTTNPTGNFPPPPPPGSGPKTPPVNPLPGSTNLTPAEARRGAEMVTDMILSGYKALHKVAYKLVEVSDNELINLHIDGKIDMNMRVPLNAEQTKHLGLQEFFQNFNRQAKEALTVSDDFISSVREPMINCCIKWGWTAPEEYYVLYKFGEDIGIKVMMVSGLLKTTKQMMKMFMFIHSENKKMHEEQMRKNTIVNDAPTPQPSPDQPDTEKEKAAA